MARQVSIKYNLGSTTNDYLKIRQFLASDVVKNKIAKISLIGCPTNAFIGAVVKVCFKEELTFYFFRFSDKQVSLLEGLTTGLMWSFWTSLLQMC